MSLLVVRGFSDTSRSCEGTAKTGKPHTLMSTNVTYPSDLSTNVRIEERFGESYVYATFGGVEERVINFYSDEIRFSVDELTGKTVQQITDIWMAKDTAYLRS